MKKTLLSTIVLLIFLMISLHAHEDDKSQKDTTKKQETHQIEDTEKANRAEKNTEEEESTIFAPFSAFPNLHPMVVHFPVVLLLIALLSQLAGLFVFKKELGWVTFLLLLGAFAGALLASLVFHPHAYELAAEAQQVLESHESLASWTMWLSGIALLLKGISHFMLKQNRWLEILIFLVITGSAITVTLTGHLGSQLVFIEEVGPGGNNIG